MSRQYLTHTGSLVFMPSPSLALSLLSLPLSLAYSGRIFKYGHKLGTIERPSCTPRSLPPCAPPSDYYLFLALNADRRKLGQTRPQQRDDYGATNATAAIPQASWVDSSLWAASLQIHSPACLAVTVTICMCVCACVSGAHSVVLLPQYKFEQTALFRLSVYTRL